MHVASKCRRTLGQVPLRTKLRKRISTVILWKHDHFHLGQNRNKFEPVQHVTKFWLDFQIFYYDRLPQHVCDRCLEDLGSAFTFWKQCVEVQRNQGCDEVDEDQYHWCQLCAEELSVDELVSISEYGNVYPGVKVSEMIRLLLDKEIYPSGAYICGVCLNSLEHACGFKKRCIESEEFFLEDTLFAWEKMEFQKSKPTHLVVELQTKALLQDNGDVRCAVCSLERHINILGKICAGCKLAFSNFYDLKIGPNRIKTPETTPKEDHRYKRSIEITDDPPDNDNDAESSNDLFDYFDQEEPYCCGCSQVMKSSEELQKHREEHHSSVVGDLPFRCDQCNRSFRKMKTLHKHKARPLARCRTCETTFISMDEVEHHHSFIHASDVPVRLSKLYDTIIPDRFHCCGCERTFETEANLTKHCSEDHPMPVGESRWICEQCHQVFDQQAALKIHQAGYGKEKRYRCRIGNCFKLYMAKGLMEHHVSTVPHRNATIPTSTLEYPLITEADQSRNAEIDIKDRHGCTDELSDHQKIIDIKSDIIHVYDRSDQFCCGCHREFDSNEELEQHLKQSHSTANDDFSFRCQKCNKGFRLAANLDKHYSTAVKLYRCSVCEVTLCDYAQVKHHLDYIHVNGEPPAVALRKLFQKFKDGGQIFYKCKIGNCSEKFKKLRNAELHVSRISHEKRKVVKERMSKQFYCCVPHCVFHSACYESTVEHARSEHPKEREQRALSYKGLPFSCRVCAIGFESKTKMIKHRNRASSQRCKRCRKTKKKDSYLAHVQECYALKSTPHIKKYKRKRVACSICGEMLPTVHIKYHMAAHENKREWQCKICSMTFNNRHNLVMHGRVHSNERPYQCREGCDKSYKYSYDRTRHEQVVHLGILAFSCTECSESFVRNRDLQLHLRKHTGRKLFSCKRCGADYDKKSEIIEHEEQCTEPLSKGMM